MAADKIDGEYRRMRLKVFLGAFFGYAAYYLVRKNLSLAAPGMIEDGLLDKETAGFAMAGIPIAYAFSKFIMGSLSDHSDARKFLVIGLIIASSVMAAVGLIPYSASIAVNGGILFAFMLAVGWLSVWDGLRVAVSWRTGSRRMSVVSRCRYGTARTMWVVVHSAC